MLMPKKVKYRKQQRGRMRGKAWRGSSLEFGDFGLVVLNLVILLVKTAVSFDRQRRHNWKLKGRWFYVRGPQEVARPLNSAGSADPRMNRRPEEPGHPQSIGIG